MRISIITINYNNIQGLKNTLSSVLEQDYNNIEYIVIDGGSTDGSKDLLVAKANELHYWVSEQDKGLYNAMNKGIAQSTGDYLIFMNSGDVFFNKYVLSAIFVNRKYEADILYGNTVYKYGQKGILRFPQDLAVMQYELPFCHQSCFIKGKLMRNNLYNESYKLIADYAFFYHCWKGNRKFQRINKIVAIYDTTGISSDDKRTWQIYEEGCKIQGRKPNKREYKLKLWKNKFKKIVRDTVPSRLLDILMQRPQDSNRAISIDTIQQI